MAWVRSWFFELDLLMIERPRRLKRCGNCSTSVPTRRNSTCIRWMPQDDKEIAMLTRNMLDILGEASAALKSLLPTLMKVER